MRKVQPCNFPNFYLYLTCINTGNSNNRNLFQKLETGIQLQPCNIIGSSSYAMNVLKCQRRHPWFILFTNDTCSLAYKS